MSAGEYTQNRPSRIVLNATNARQRATDCYKLAPASHCLTVPTG